MQNDSNIHSGRKNEKNLYVSFDINFKVPFTRGTSTHGPMAVTSTLGLNSELVLYNIISITVRIIQ